MQAIGRYAAPFLNARSTSPSVDWRTESHSNAKEEDEYSDLRSSKNIGPRRPSLRNVVFVGPAGEVWFFYYLFFFLFFIFMIFGKRHWEN
jgi:hypothetical protein